jgi:hypothetical protein
MKVVIVWKCTVWLLHELGGPHAYGGRGAGALRIGEQARA